MRDRITRAKDEARALGDVPAQLAEIQRMTTGQLAAKHLELFGEPTRSRNKDYLLKRLAWRIQEQAEGGLSGFTLTKIAELGDTLPERWARRQVPAAQPEPTSAQPARDRRLPPIGTVLKRVHGGVTHEVRVEPDGFTYAGQHFRSLSAVARRITGTQWNGMTFFGLAGAAL